MLPYGAECFDIKVGDLDIYGHVNHVTYFYYLEETTVRFLNAHGIKISPEGITPVVANVNCKFIRSINYPATILIDSVALKVSPKKLLITHTIKSSDSIIVHAIAEKTMIWFDTQLKVAVDLPQLVISNLHLN